MNSLSLVITICFLILTYVNSVGMSDIQNRFNSPDKQSSLSAGQPDSTLADRKTDEGDVKTGTGQFDESQCDLVADGPVCLYNGDRILLPYAVPKGLVGYWNFDESLSLDNSGNKNHAIGEVKAGPAFGGLGSSAYFGTGNGDFLKIPYTKLFEPVEFSVTFWFFLIEESYSTKGTRNCPLIQRGNDDLFSKKFERSPALYFDRKTKNLKAFVKTGDEDSIQGESVNSNARLMKQRWHHIGLVNGGGNLKLYINGILDAQLSLKSDTVMNTGDLFIGNVPWLKDQCNFPFLLDEVRYYNNQIDEDFIQAEASPTLGGVEPSFLTLGCMNCSLKDASQACTEGYRLCSSIELHTGGYQIARSMGWLDSATHMWTHGALKTPEDFDKLKGLALCCAELK